MWNSFRTDAIPTIVAGPVKITSGQGDEIGAYVARPDGAGPYPGIVVTRAIGGLEEYTTEFARRFAFQGYLAIVPELYSRFGQGAPDDVAAKARTEGGVSDASVVADAQGAVNWLKAFPGHNGKLGVIGPCSGGRHSLLVGSSIPEFNAVVDLWGAGVVASADQLNEKRPVAVVDMTPNLTAPLLGIFGNEDRSPSPEQVNVHEEALKAAGKSYMFHRYDGAGHGIWHYQPTSYRQAQAMDGWEKVLTFFGQYLA